MPLANRATIGNMSPEYGSTARDLPDRRRDPALPAPHRPPRGAGRAGRGLRQGAGPLARPGRRSPLLRRLELDLATVVPSLAGPKRPQDRVLADRGEGRRSAAAAATTSTHRGRRRPVDEPVGRASRPPTRRPRPRRSPAADDCERGPTSADRPRRDARRRHDVRDRPRGGGHRGDHVVHEHVQPVGHDRRRAVGEEGGRARADPQAVGEDHAGARARRWSPTTTTSPASRPTWRSSGSTSSATAAPPASATPGRCPRRSARRCSAADLAVVSVLSGNRNFEGRINPDVKMNYLASPPLVVAYAIAGTMDIDITTDPLGTDEAGKPVYLRDIWPTPAEVQETIADSHRRRHVHRALRRRVRRGRGCGSRCRRPPATRSSGTRLDLRAQAAVLRGHGRRSPPRSTDIAGARVLAKLGDSVTTDHISPAGSIKADSPAGRYLADHGVGPRDFNSYGSRRGNHEVMIRGTFANIRLRNQLLDGVEGGFTRDFTAGRRRRRRSTTPPSPTRRRASRWWSWPARSTAPAPRATGRPRAPPCWASGRSSPSPTSGSTGRT